MWIWRSEDDSPRQVNAPPGKGRGLSTAPGLSSGDTSSPGKGGGSGGGGGGAGDQTGVVSASGWDTITNQRQNGWRFLVGGNDLSVTHLRFYHEGTLTETVNLWDAATETLLATAEVSADGGWAEAEITPVTLTAGQEYVVAHRHAGGAQRTFYYNPSSFSLHAEVSWQATHIDDTAGFPGSNPTSSKHIEADIRFSIL